MTDILKQAASIATQREQSYHDPAFYRKALDEGDFETLITYCELAMTDDELAAMMERVDEEFKTDISPEDLAKAMEVVRNVINKHRLGEL